MPWGILLTSGVVSQYTGQTRLVTPHWRHHYHWHIVPPHFLAEGDEAVVSIDALGKSVLRIV